MNMPPLKHEAILASAGCGKTEALSTRYIGLLLRGVPPDRILALTFTRVAAGEIAERIMLRLAKAASDDAERGKLQKALGIDSLPRAAVATALASMLAQVHRLRIGTLDSFFLEIVKAFALELGMPTPVEIADAFMERQLQDDALRTVFTNARTGTSFGDLEDIFTQLTFGKEAANVASRLRDVVTAGYTLYLDTEQAAWSAVSPMQPDLDEGTLPQYLDRLLQSDDKDLQATCCRAKDAAWDDILTKGRTAKIADGVFEYNRKPIDQATIDLLTPLVGYAHYRLLEPARQITAAYYRFLDLYHTAYAEVKRSRGMVTFNDIARLLLRRCVVQPDGEGMYLYYRLDGRIDHILVDEFQDTSVLQWRDIEPIAAELLASDCARSVFLVGDIKQAIYGWRGGSAALLGKIVGHYNQAQNHIVVRQLVHSYRSGQDILDTVNTVFGGGHPDVAPWNEATTFEPHVSATGATSYAELRATDGHEAQSRYDAAAELLKAIEPWNRGLTAAVLCRKNAVVNDVLDTLKQHGVPACSLGRNRIMDNPAVQLVVSALRLADMPLDGLARYHVSHSCCAAAWFDLARAPLPALRALRIQLASSSYADVVGGLVAPLRPHVDGSTRQALDQLVDLAAAYEPWATSRTADFIAFAEQAPVQDAANSSAVVGMTIHGAKGLGFDIVVMPDLDQSYKKTGRNAYVYTASSDAKTLTELSRVEKILVAPRSVLKKVNEDVRTMIEDYDAARQEEFFNTYYVAMTRAKRGLYMLVSDPETNSFGKILLETLPSTPPAPQAPMLASARGTALYAKGTAEWFKEHPVRPCEVGRGYVPPAVTLAPASSRRRPHRTPSSQERMVLSDRGKWFSSGSHRAANAGKIVHAMFSAIEWLDHDALAQLQNHAGPVWEKAGARARADVPGLDEAEYAAGEARFLVALGGKDVRKALLRPSQPCEVARELPFAALVGDAVVTGRCDRVVFHPSQEKPERIEVYDFKTDQISSDNDRMRAEANYEPQLDHYRRALSAIHGVPMKKTASTLLFV